MALAPFLFRSFSCLCWPSSVFILDSRFYSLVKHYADTTENFVIIITQIKQSRSNDDRLTKSAFTPQHRGSLHLPQSIMHCPCHIVAGKGRLHHKFDYNYRCCLVTNQQVPKLHYTVIIIPQPTCKSNNIPVIHSQS